MSNKTKRAKLLDDLLGPGSADQVADATKAAQEVLDAAGVQRKEAGIVERAAKAWRKTFGSVKRKDAPFLESELARLAVEVKRAEDEWLHFQAIMDEDDEDDIEDEHDLLRKLERLEQAYSDVKRELRAATKEQRRASKGIFSSRDESRANALIDAVEVWSGQLEDLDEQWTAAVRDGQDTSGIDRERRELEAKIDNAERELQSIGYEEYTKEAKVTDKKKVDGIIARVKAKLAERRKAEGEEPKEGEGAPVLEVLAAVGATEVSDAVKRIHEVLSKAGVLEAVVKAAGSEEDLSNMLAMAIAGGAPKQEDQQAQQANQPAAAEVVQQPAAVKALKELVGQFAADTAEDLGKVARSQLQLTEQQLDFEARLKQLEGRFADAPRRASQDESTLIQDPELATALQKQLAETEIIAGIRVLKEAPNGNHQ